MPRGATATPPAALDPLAAATVADEIDYDLSYSQILAKNGAFRQPGRGIVHKMVIGSPYQARGGWRQDTKVYPVAMSAEEARERTRQTGIRHDYYEPGATCEKCLKAGGDGIVSGWVLGGRKFQTEHQHVTNRNPEEYGYVEVDPPGVSDEAAASMED